MRLLANEHLRQDGRDPAAGDEVAGLDVTLGTAAQLVHEHAPPAGETIGRGAIGRQVVPFLWVRVQVEQLLVAGAGEPDVLLAAVSDPVHGLPQRGVLAVEVGAPTKC